MISSGRKCSANMYESTANCLLKSLSSNSIFGNDVQKIDSDYRFILFVGLSRIDLLHNCNPASIKIKILLILIANLCIVCIRLQFVYWNMLLKCLKTHADVHGDDDVTAQILDKRIIPTDSEVSRPSPWVTMCWGRSTYLHVFKSRSIPDRLLVTGLPASSWDAMGPWRKRDANLY
jgi:hypothetical protein